MLGVTALDHVDVQLNHISSHDFVIFRFATRIRWFKDDGYLTLVTYDMTICKNGVIVQQSA